MVSMAGITSAFFSPAQGLVGIVHLLRGSARNGQLTIKYNKQNYKIPR